MSQLTLTPEEDQLILSALRSKANQYAAMFGCDEPAILELIAKVEGQLPVVESAPAAIEVVEPEVVVEQPENEPTQEEVEAHFAAEEAVEEKPVKAKKAK
jgi:SpoU rRNA methylase family enzyme